MTTISEQQTRVVLIDDHPTMRAGVKGCLERVPDISVVGEASTGEQALTVLRATTPDVVFLDIRLPDIDGIALLREIKRVSANTKVVMLSCQTDPSSVRMAVEAGACGYLTKLVGPQEIVDAVRRVQRGQVPISADVATHLLSAVRGQRREGEPALTPREREVWRAMAHGLSNCAIAESLFVSERTVKFHVHNVLRKLGLTTRAEAICAAHHRGMSLD